MMFKEKIMFLFDIILAIFFVLQFIIPPLNQALITEYDIFEIENSTPEIRKMVINSCYDCHSDNTSYKLFDRISPIAWYINSNIESGKNSLNFSEWGKMDELNKEIIFQAILFDIKTHKMPKKKYLELHPDAELNEDQINDFSKWIIQLKYNLINDYEDNNTDDVDQFVE